MKPLRVLLPLFAAGACSLVAPRLPGADEVLRQAPAAYQETLAPLLTTLAAATGIDAKALEEKAPGITLLDERLYTLREDGRRLIARQLVRKALTDAGAHGMADEIFTFRRKEQKFYLLTAETIQPDGTVQAVGPDAVLVNSPQRQAQYALYDDQAEVRIIFPNVKPGSITHAVVVIEDVRARMPGQFTEMFTWTSNWPYGRVHYVVDLPPALAARLKIHMVGRDVPAVTRMEQPDGHVRFASEKTLIRPSLDETSPAPAEQVGPCLHLSTVPDWGAVGRWYGGLLKGRDQLTPALAKQVDTWTKDAANPDAVVNLLFDKVANDVRYTGLELGEADYQPHDCNAVWENQYGDCKDKANLLLALLRHQGVAANLVLVNASDAGLIDRRSPDFRVFSHAIVALPDDRGGYRFCDPTIARSRPGILSPTDADRDVLVITDDGADWAHTPAMTAGRMDYRFDLGLRPTGELSGWFSLSAEGFYGAMDEDWFRKLDATEGRQAVAEMVRDFYPGAEVIDVKYTPSAKTTDPFLLKAYVSIARRLESGRGEQPLAFPRTNHLFAHLGATLERNSPFFLYRGHWSVAQAVTLPPGMAPGELPAPYDVDTPAGAIRATWQTGPGSCQAEMDFDMTQAVLSPDEFKSFYTEVQSLRGWLEKPVVLSLNLTAPPRAESEVTLQDFPQMPTGTGQLALLDTRYPRDGSLALRRAALDRTLQYFPNDKPTLFQGGALLAEVDWMEGKKKEALARIDVLLATYKGDLKPDLYAWGRYVYASILHLAERNDEAGRLYADLARDTTLPEDFRARCAFGGADLLKTTAPDQARALLEPAIALHSGVQPELYGLLAYVLLEQQHADLVRQCLGDLKQSQPGAVEDLFERIVRTTQNWTAAGDDARQQALFDIVHELMPQAGAGLQATLGAARANRDLSGLCVRMREQLAGAVVQKPLADWYKPAKDEGLKTDVDFDRAIRLSDGTGDRARSLQLCVQALLTMPADALFSARWSRAAGYADLADQTAVDHAVDPILDLLLDGCDGLPHSEVAYWTGQLCRASRLARRSDVAGQQALLTKTVADPALPDRFRPSVFVQLGLSYEKSADYEHALQAYAGAERYVGSAPGVVDAMLHAIFLNLQLTHPEEAVRIIGVLEGLNPASLRAADDVGQIQEFIALHRAGVLPEFWTRSKAWWPQWRGLIQGQGLPPEGLETAVPAMTSSLAWGTEIGTALRRGDKIAFFQQIRRGMSAARWLPSPATDLAAMVALVAQNGPDIGVAYRKLVIRILEQEQDALGDPDRLRTRELMLAAGYVDDGNYKASLDLATTFVGGDKTDDPVSRAMHRVLAAAAVSSKTDPAASINLLKQDLEKPTADRADTIFWLAEAMAAAGKGAEALQLLEREVARLTGPNDAAARVKLTAERDKLRAPPVMTLDECNQALRQNPNNAGAYRQRGLLREAAHDHTDAIDDYTRALALDPTSAETYVDRGTAHYNREELDEAGADFTKALELDPRSTAARTNLGYVKYRRRQYAAAIADFTTVIAADPKNRQAIINRGVAEKDSGDLAAALDDFQRLVDLNPNDADAYNNRGTVKELKRDYEGAAADYTAAIAITSNPTFYSNRSRVLQYLGNTRDAGADTKMATNLRLTVVHREPAPSSGPPTLVSAVRPAYPADMFKQKISAIVVVGFTVDENGDVAKAEIVGQSDPRFAAAAVAAVLQWKFHPGTANGRPKPTHMQVPIVFSVDKEAAANATPPPDAR